MAPHLYSSTVAHVRTERLENRFRYRVYHWLIDVDDVPRLPRALRPLARFEARDHLGDPSSTLRANVDRYLATQGVDLAGGRVLLLSSARSLGYVFNPISVWWCHDASGELACIVAEVHNTYGERHCYLLRPDDGGRCEVDKEFYVSPFFMVDGRYRMRFSAPGERVHVAITLERGDAAVFHASLVGERRPATTANVLRTVLRHPFVTWKVMLLIRLQGIRLFLRRVPVIRRPPHSPQEGVE